MLNEIRRLMESRPFAPFVIYLTNGRALAVPTLDHIAFAPNGKSLVVFENDGTANMLASLHITNVSFDAATVEQSTSPSE